MGACMSSRRAANGEKVRSNSIDKEIEQDAKKMRKECKILMLGAGESGKSTVVKQMKILHQNGFTKGERNAYRIPIYNNLLECALRLINAMNDFGIQPSSPRVQQKMEYLSNYQLPADPNVPISPEVGEAMTFIWSDPCIPDILARQNEFYIMDTAPYFFSQAARITSPDYLPNNDDILNARIKTTGVFDTRFNMKQLNIHMFDVGGQRSERRKWIHCFENVTAIIFCVALNEFDQVLLENKDVNRLAESLDLFESVINSRWFMRTGVILFLNKIDVFPRALQRSLLSDYFKEYTGANEPEPAAKFILWKFTCVNRAHLTIYPHLTQATDTRNIRHVFDVVSQTLLQNALKDTGIIL